MKLIADPNTKSLLLQPHNLMEYLEFAQMAIEAAENEMKEAIDKHHITPGGRDLFLEKIGTIEDTIQDIRSDLQVVK